MAGIDALLESIQQTQTQILIRLNNLEVQSGKVAGKQEEIATTLACLSGTAHDRDAKVQVLRRPFLDLVGTRLVNTTELLEAILLHVQDSCDIDSMYAGLDASEKIHEEDTAFMRWLLSAQRVSKQFKALIDGSLKLQRALIFVPDSTGSTMRLNALLIEKQILHHASIRLTRTPPTQLLRASLADGPAKSAWHVMLRYSGRCSLAVGTAMTLELEAYPHYCCCNYHNTYKGAYAASSSTGCFDNPREGSWKRMYLTQPPVGVTWRDPCRLTKGSTVAGRVNNNDFGGFLKSGTVEEMFPGL